MYEYDAALKLLLQASSGSVLCQAVGHAEVTHWFDAEFKQVQMHILERITELKEPVRSAILARFLVIS